MKVKDFSKEIVKAAVNNAEGKTFSRSKVGLLAVITSSLSGPSIEIFGNPLYHLSGLLTYIPNRISDVYSTYQLAKLSEDPRFKEYGLEKIVYEETSSFLPKQLTRKDVLNKKHVAFNVLGGILSTAFPPVGYGLVASAPFVYENNTTFKRYLEKSFEIGDDVNQMIEKGLTKGDIKYYLNLLNDRRKICKECKAIHKKD